MQETAAAYDLDYLLQGLNIATVQLILNRQAVAASPRLDEATTAIIRYLRDHPGATVTDLWIGVPHAHDDSYEATRQLVVRLVRAGLLKMVGGVPLESVDLRYERLSCCDVCGAPASGHPILFWKHNTPVVRCTGCELMYSNPRWKGEYLFQGYGESYWDDYKSLVSGTAQEAATNQARWDPYLDALEPARRTGRLLDVGCATGEFLAAAQARGWETYGVEIAPEAAAQATARTGSPVHVGTLDSAPYGDEMFDVVTLWDVLEHVQSPRAYVAHIARLIRPGGMFALTTPNIRSLAYWVLGRRWWVIGPNGHIYYFAPRTLAALLQRQGFDIHWMGTMNMGLDTWQHWVRSDRLQWLRPLLARATAPLADRFLWGEELYMIARKHD